MLWMSAVSPGMPPAHTLPPVCKVPPYRRPSHNALQGPGQVGLWLCHFSLVFPYSPVPLRLSTNKAENDDATLGPDFQHPSATLKRQQFLPSAVGRGQTPEVQTDLISAETEPPYNPIPFAPSNEL